MPDGGILTISVEQVNVDEGFFALHGYGAPGTYGLITVTDTGTGMNAETQLKIFDPFFTTKEVGKGTGLGLSIIYGIIKEHDGYITVYSEPDMGTTFRIYLPVIAETGADGAKAEAMQYPRRGTETILFAEDDEYMRSLTTMVLKEFGYTVLTADNGEAAISVFEKNRDRIDLLLFDLIMPGKNGKAAFEEIRRVQPDMRAIFLSGYPADVLRQKELFTKDARQVMKPVSPMTLLNVIREELDKGGSAELAGLS
jgi:CheY-like chemotaxis protein